MGKLKLHLTVLVIGIAFGYIALSGDFADQYNSYFNYFIDIMGSLFSKPDPTKEALKTIDEIISKESVEFVDIVHSDGDIPTSSSKHQFSVLSYNVLAEGYSDRWASDAGDIYINFKYRSLLMVEEIKRFNADIILLQEIDHYDDTWLPSLTALGYELVNAARTKKIDSSVVGYKKDKFELLETKILDFNVGHKYEKKSDFIRNNVAAVLKLKHKGSGKTIHVLGTHFFWNPRKEHVKYLQMGEVVKYFSENNKEDDIIVWGGDLNSKANDNNIVYLRERAEPKQERIEMYTEAMLKYQVEIFNDIEKIENKLPWGNAYGFYGQSIGDKENKFPKYTNFTKKFKDVLDHILYSKKTLIPRKLLRVPDEKQIKTDSTPNQRYPSDHLPIMAVFEIL